MINYSRIRWNIGTVIQYLLLCYHIQYNNIDTIHSTNCTSYQLSKTLILNLNFKVQLSCFARSDTKG